jgi:hypothetical protein
MAIQMISGFLSTDGRCARILRNLHAQYWLLAIAIAVAGCKSGDGSPTPGKVSVEFVGMSDSEVIVTLANGLDRAIYIEGSRNFSRAIQVWSSETEIVCKTAPGRSESALFGFTHGREPKFIELSPNKRAKLIIPTTFPQQHKGSLCHLQLMLKDGTIVGPTEFRP